MNTAITLVDQPLNNDGELRIIQNLEHCCNSAIKSSVDTLSIETE